MAQLPPETRIASLLVMHRTSLYGYLYACVRNRHDAEDLLQEVCLAVTQSIDKLTSDDGFLPWAREIARRRVLEYYRKRSPAVPLAGELADQLAAAWNGLDQQPGGPSPGRREALLECLDNLPRESRRVLLMRYDGSVKDMGELAGKIGRTMAATYGLIKRIRFAVRDCIEAKIARSSSNA